MRKYRPMGKNAHTHVDKNENRYKKKKPPQFVLRRPLFFNYLAD